MSLRISLLIQGMLDLIGTNLDRMDFLMAAKKDLDHFLQKMSILSLVLQSGGQNLPRVQGPHKKEMSSCLEREHARSIVDDDLPEVLVGSLTT